MTRKETTGIRSLDFSGWVRERLPDSNTGFSASDLDFIFWNWKTNHIMFVEVKTRNAKCRKGQYMMWQRIHKWIQKGIDKDWNYLGFNLVTFENSTFDDGKVFLNNKEVTEKELIDFLSFETHRRPQ